MSPTDESLVERCFSRFQSHHAHHDLGSALDAFDEALGADPVLACRVFLSRASGPMAQCLHHTRRAATLGATLDGLFAGHPGMNLHLDWPQERIQTIIDLRDRNIDRGLPSVVHVTQGKSASVPVANIFNSGYNLPSFAYSLTTIEVVSSWARDFARGGACFSTHLDPRPANLRRLKEAGVTKVVVHVRDPRQAILSLIHHVTRYSDQLVSLARSGFESRSIEDQLDDVMEFYISRIAWIQGWLEAEEYLGILFSTFEDFVQDRTAFTRRYIEYYGGREEHFSWEDATNIDAGIDQHFRSGRIDEWREIFPPKSGDFLTELIPERMRQRFGWPA